VSVDVAAPLETPVWFGPLREPAWLLPPVRDDAPTIVFAAEPWQERGVDADGEDLRLGVPLYLAEAARFGTNARALALRHVVEPEYPHSHGVVTVRSAVAPGGVPSIRLRMFDGQGEPLDEVVRDAHDPAALGGALGGMLHAVTQASAPGGVRPIWNSLYALPSGIALTSYVRGLHAALRVTDEALPETAHVDALSERRAHVRSVLASLGALATSASEPFPALLFFGALAAAADARSSVVGEFRLQANARCITATDPLDPVYSMAVLVMHLFGDRAAAERRAEALRAGGDERVARWVARVRGEG
jgi:hypothetical protein